MQNVWVEYKEEPFYIYYNPALQIYTAEPGNPNTKVRVV